jgi:hypothetical protein
VHLDVDKRDERSKTEGEGHTNIRCLPAREDGLVSGKVEEDEAQNAGYGSEEIELDDVVV